MLPSRRARSTCTSPRTKSPIAARSINALYDAETMCPPIACPSKSQCWRRYEEERMYECDACSLIHVCTSAFVLHVNVRVFDSSLRVATDPHGEGPRRTVEWNPRWHYRHYRIRSCAICTGGEECRDGKLHGTHFLLSIASVLSGYRRLFLRRDLMFRNNV